MLLINTTRSLTSHVSYLIGIIFAAAFGGRARFGEKPWLGDEVLEAELARVVEDAAVIGCDGAPTASVCLRDICGARLGSGGGASGETDLSLRFAPILDVSKSAKFGAAGGEYCVPASTVDLVGDFLETERERLCNAWPL